MRRWCRTGATLAIGAGLGAAVSRLLSPIGGEEEPDRFGLLSRIPVVPVPSVQASELTVSPGGSGAAMKYGFPSLANIKTRESYVISYDPRTRTASWVIEKLNPASLSGPSDRKCCEFKEDDSVHVFHRSTNQDYKGSGFDRGHLAAAANHKWSQKAMEDTFYLSNIAPQVSKHIGTHYTHINTTAVPTMHTLVLLFFVFCVKSPHLNQVTWNNLEKLCRSLTKRYLNVYVCSGPLYLPRQEADGKFYVRYQVIGRNHVSVPTHFFKVLILEQMDGRGVELRSYVLPNETTDEKVPLERFLVPIETIERASGLLFVPNIMKRTSSLQAITNK
ncbi:endonuclease G, mitochondrial isoform X1 [Solea solea]|uniref:endonuclease G, mitochondrial isoform X1 n=1 Tax=Solea solea TaxID=90069 RepID=UPI00272B13E9|nr:endonuclease G, mitochondrial isoform X1 [Solea solea]